MMATALRLALLVLTLISIAAPMGPTLALALLAAMVAATSLLEFVGFGLALLTSHLAAMTAPSLRAALLTLLTDLALHLGLLTAIVPLSGFATVFEVRLVYRVGFEPAVLLPAALSLPSGLSASSLGPLLLVVSGSLLTESLPRLAGLVGLLASLLVSVGHRLGAALPAGLGGRLTVARRSLALVSAALGTLGTDVAATTAAEHAVEPAPVVALSIPVGVTASLVAARLPSGGGIARAVGRPFVPPSSVTVVVVVHRYVARRVVVCWWS